VQNALSIIERCSERFVSQDDSRYVIVWRNCVSLCQVGVSCVNCLSRPLHLENGRCGSLGKSISVTLLPAVGEHGFAVHVGLPKPLICVKSAELFQRHM
jgi:hypothetical protein